MLETPAPESDASPESDDTLWAAVRNGDTACFGRFVARYQSLVCAIAYSVCGDLALSEDVAQETFWAAWRQRNDVHQPDNLRAWLCGIARNLALAHAKEAKRKADRASGHEGAVEAASRDTDPADSLGEREEQVLLWRTLERLPESYRVPLILFYREGQSVAAVATALELTPDAVKQRLSRGRELLRDRLADVVASTLGRTRPGRVLTGAVLAGLSTLSMGAKAAPGAAGVASAAAMGTVGGLLGSLVGIFGGFAGPYLAAQAAPTMEDRRDMTRVAWRILAASLVFTAVLLAGIGFFAGSQSMAGYLIFLAITFVGFCAYVRMESTLAARRARRRQGLPGTPNDSPLRRRLEVASRGLRGRVWRSRWSLLGWPLVEFNVSDPMPQSGAERTPRTARAWIAVGDRAIGLLVAVGGTAIAPVAVGGRAVGLISLGGVAVGGVAIGGLSLGGLALGGVAIGYLAAGGGAIGWQLACGGGAVAWHSAIGGAAFARHLAVGGEAMAAQANTPEARALLEAHPLTIGFLWLAKNPLWFDLGSLALCLTLLLLAPLMYRREAVTRP